MIHANYGQAPLSGRGTSALLCSYGLYMGLAPPQFFTKASWGLSEAETLAYEAQKRLRFFFFFSFAHCHRRLDLPH